MNNRKETTPVQDYLERLPLGEAERQQLASGVGSTDAEGLASLHGKLAFTESVGNDPALSSVEARLKMGWGDALSEGDLLTVDAQGRTNIRTMPAITRSQMLPEPWRTNPVVRIWHRLLGRKQEARQVPDEEADAHAHWRKVGAFRRFILLVLMLLQTGIATWYMKAVLPYQGWSLVDLGEVWDQGLLESARQVLPYVLQTSILLLFATLFCWVSAGFWTALMGFWQLLTGRDKYSISASTVGDEVIAPEARTAIVMPIANEDVARVFAGLRATYE